MPKFPEWLASTLASDATEGQGVLPNSIQALAAASHIIGPARVVLMSQDDNLSVRTVMEAPPAPGSVLVVAGGSTSRTATIGGLMALEMQQAGISAWSPMVWCATHARFANWISASGVAASPPSLRRKMVPLSLAALSYLGAPRFATATL